MHSFSHRRGTWAGRLAVAAFAAAVFVTAGAQRASAHQDPPGCSGTAVDFSFMAFRDDNTPIDLSETVTECETIHYQVTVGKSSLGNPCAFQGGTITITTPDGIVHNVTPGGGVPCIGGTGACSALSAASNTVNYTVSPGDVSGGAVTAAASYTAAFSHTGVSHTIGFPKASTTLPLLVEFCPASSECLDSFCDPNLDSSSGALGNCTTSPVPDSTPCTDTDGTNCTHAGCDGAGSCDQDHQVVVCPSDGNPCTNDGGCDSTTGACVYTNTPDSTPCPDTDSNACTIAGCNGAGSCDQNHNAIVCAPDANECTSDPACNPLNGLCTHPPVPDSTPCTDSDSLACTTAGCEAGVCVQGHISTCVAPVDHFQCYEVKRTTFTAGPVTLVDGFGSFTGVTVQRPERLCNPADKNDEDNSAPTHEDHLLLYKVRFSSLPQPGRTVVDQFGTHVLDVSKADRLMVPAAKSMVGTPPPLSTPTVDHFDCYKVRRPKNSPPFAPVPNVKIDDQFATITVTVKKPLRLCIPSNKNNESPGAESHPQSLLCYRTTKVPLGPVTPTVRDQFGVKNVDLLRRTEFCVPSTLQ
jgi:hypothetical protein